MTARPVGIPNPTPGNTQQTLQRLVEVVNALQGVIRSESKAITVEDLILAGVVTKDQNGALSLAAGLGLGNALPSSEGYADAGTAAAASREDHVHPLAGTNPNYIHPLEKMNLRMEYQQLLNDRVGLLASAAAFGVTTEATDFNNALDALTTYLVGLTTPVAWDDKSDVTSLI